MTAHVRQLDRIGGPAELTAHEIERRRIHDAFARALCDERDQQTRPADRLLSEAIKHGAVADQDIPHRVADVETFVRTYGAELSLLSALVDVGGVHPLVLQRLTPGQRAVVLHRAIHAVQTAVAEVVADLESHRAAA